MITVVPGVNFTKQGTIIIDLVTWAKIKVNGLLRVATTGGKDVTVRHGGHDLHEEKRKVK